MPLNTSQLRNLKRPARPLKLFDGHGLYLLVQPGGARYWRLKYRLQGREKVLALGSYPEVTLRQARDLTLDARRLLAQGVDPSVKRKQEKAQRISTLEAVAREWIPQARGTALVTQGKILRRLEIDVFPRIGSHPIADINAASLLDMLRKVEARGAHETAHRLRIDLQRIFTYAIATQRAVANPAVGLDEALKPVVVKHRAAITEPSEIGPLLRAVDAYPGSFIVRCALRLAPLVFVRPGELRHACWGEFDLDEALWAIPGARMKLDRAHIVPLSRQALAILREVEQVSGSGDLVFPSVRTHARPLSENTLNAALRTIGYDRDTMSAHGFRAMARTVLDEVLGCRVDIIEHQLAHAVRDPNGRAYNRTQFLPQRREMMQAWADYLDELRALAGTRSA